MNRVGNWKSAVAGLAVAMCASAALGQETRFAEDDPEPPAASISDAAWLIGSWEGADPKGDRSIEQWRAPIGGLMVGTFVQTARDAEGVERVESTAHMHLWEANGTLNLATMSIETGGEPLVGPFALIAVEPCALYFNELTMRCNDKQRPEEGFTVFWRESWPGEPLKESSIKYKKAGED